MTESERRLAFRVEYDGTSYHGWQAQPDGCPTIQGTLQDTLSGFLGCQTDVQGASRTDAGVHARDQMAAATIRHPIRAEGLVKAVNQRLPAAIAIRDAHPVPLDYNPRFGNRSKTYCYRVYCSKVRSPLLDRFSWRIPWALDLDFMRQASADLIGTHDFTSFAASDGSHKTAERTILTYAITSDSDGVIELRVTGTAFLKQMVRNLTGTLVDIGRGRLSPNCIPEIIAAKDRRHAGPTAPARGLTLEKIELNELGSD